MKKKKTIIAVASLLLIAVIGATFAYYTSNTSFENVFNAGKYKVTLTEVFESPDNWVPGETVPKTVTAKNEGTVPAAVRISYTEQWLKEIDGVETDITSQVSPNPAIINFDNQDDWTSSNGYYYYKYILEPTAETSSFISGVTLDPNLDSVTCTGEGTTKTCEAQNKASGAKYKLTFTIQTVQYDQYQNVWQTNVEITEKTAIRYLTRQVEGQITPGDVIGIGETEDFYVVSSTPEKTVLLAKYNLLIGYNLVYNDDWDIEIISTDTPGYGLQNVEAYGYTSIDSFSYAILPFSSTNYWDDDGLNSKYGDSYPADVYDSELTAEPVFSLNDFDTPGYSTAYFLEQYKSRLIAMGAPSSITSRLLTYSEAGTTDSSIITNIQYSWLGTAEDDTHIYYISSSGSISSGEYLYGGNGCGLRPVIEIPTSELQ